MAEIPANQTTRRRSKGRILLFTGGGLIALLVVLYFVCTSAAFLKGVILPRAGKAIGGEITVADASISPFSEIQLKSLKVVTTGSDPLFQAEELRARYSLWSIIRGTMAVDEVTLSTPVVHIAMKADGSSNLDPLLKGQPSSTPKSATPAASSKPPNLKLKNISIKNGTVSFVQDLKTGGQQSAQLNIESVTLDRLENGQPGKLTTATSFKMTRPTNDVIEVKGASSTEFALGPDLMPTTIKAHAEQQVVNAGGSLSQLADHRVVIDGDVTPTEVKAISKRFFRGQQLLGELKISGPLDLTKKEGRLKIEAAGIDSKLLNPIGATMGIDFGKTALDWVSEVALSQGGTVITANTRLNASNFSITQKGQTTPVLDLQLASEVTVNTAQSSAVVQQFTLDAKQNQKPLVHGSLTKPMTLAWGKNSTAAGDSSFALAVTDLNLTDWKPFLGDTINSGRFSLNLSLDSKQSGGLLTVGITSQLAGLVAKVSTNQPPQTTPPLDLQLAGEVTVNTAQSSAVVQQFTLDAKQNQKPLIHGGLTKPMTLAWGTNSTKTGDSALTIAVTDLNLSDLKPYLGDTVSAGRFSLKMDLASQQSGAQLTLGVTSQIADLAANLGSTPLNQAALAFNFNGKLTDFKKVELSDYKLDLTRQGQPALSLAGSAGYDGKLFHLQSQIHAVIIRLLGSGPESPLDVGLKLDGTMQDKKLDLQGLHLSLSPTQRAATNGMDATGQIDLTTPGTTKGRLTVKSDALDLTQLYDALTARQEPSKPRSTTPSKPGPSSSSPGETEPEPMVLPLQMTADADLKHVWLRDIAIQDCVVSAKVDGGKIKLDPCRLVLNGAPVNATADLDLGVKGYVYAVALKMDKVPLAPIADTFSPTNRGKYQGLILADARIKGAGITGTNLQKNLGGQVALAFTNAMLQVVGPKTKVLLVPIATLLRIPEITKSPLDWLAVQSTIDTGTIHLTRTEVQSAAFQARTRGDIPMAKVFTNSPLNLPVEFLLRRPLAEASSLVPPNTPTNANYVLLPDFVTVKGTIGDPSSQVNKLALGGLLLKTGEGIAEKFGVKSDGKTSEALKGIETLLTGQKSGGTNAPTTNAPPKFNPLDLLKKK